jgi:hypothetical protein
MVMCEVEQEYEVGLMDAEFEELSCGQGKRQEVRFSFGEGREQNVE